MAIDHLKNTPIDARSSFERVIAHLRQQSRSDFLVAESHSLRLATVKNGSVEELGLGYVGDDDAWEAFTVARENASPPENASSDLTLLSSVLDAFGRVVRDESHPTVAGFSMRVMSRGDGFHYAEMSGMHMVGISESLNEATAPKYSDAAAGAYSYTLLTPREPGRAVVAVHLHQGGSGSFTLRWRTTGRSR